METLASATTAALRSEGAAILDDPRRFVGYVSDLIDTDSREARVLYSGCDERFLACFEVVFEVRTSEALASAVAKATDYLRSERLLDAIASHAAAEQVALGVAQYMGIEYQPASAVTEVAAPAALVVTPVQPPAAPIAMPSAMSYAQQSIQTSSPVPSVAGSFDSHPDDPVSLQPNVASTSAAQGSASASPDAQSNARKPTWAIALIVVVAVALVGVIGYVLSTGGVGRTFSEADATQAASQLTVAVEVMPGENGFTYSEYASEAVFSEDYDLYVDGVKMPRA